MNPFVKTPKDISERIPGGTNLMELGLILERNFVERSIVKMVGNFLGIILEEFISLKIPRRAS